MFIFLNANDIRSTYEHSAIKIINALKKDSIGYSRLSYLCDMFGPRLSGSKNLEKSIDWILKEMKNDGLSKVKGERVKVPSWIRGEESLKILIPFEKKLRILGVGGSVSTPKGGIRGEVVVVNNFEDLEKIKKSVRGKIVLYNVPFTNYGETVKYRYDGPNIAAKYGAIASLIRSVGNGLMNTPHTGTMGEYKTFRKIPHAAITAEDAMMIDRICKRGQRVVLKLQMEAKFVEDRWSRNVLAELRGSTHPEEIVIVGGHIDSWDVGQGAHDDAGGCIAAWRAVTLIKELGLKPRRTIRIVLWTNEENGGRGNINYKNEHFNELENHILAIESDGGVFAPQGFGFTGSARAKKMILDISDLLEPIRANAITDWGRAADIAPLNDEGVPVMSLNVDISKYFWYHHSNADTFDKVDYRDFNNCIAAMAIMAYVIADMEEKLPR
ncbi:MAG: M20/M25/M40 family metallo-hydrolase [Candidatus Neomarinimicrobiota bacterium]